MSQYNFGSGTLIAKRTDASNTMPAFLGTLQEVTINIDSSLKALVGQRRVAIGLGAGELKITGTAKFARIQMTQMTNLVLGGTTTTGTQQFMPIAGENGNVPGSSTYTITVAQAATFVEDLGVFYKNTGIQLQPVTAGSEATGKYSVSGSGIYTFAAGDASAQVVIYYRYTASTGYQNVFTNPMMGAAPTFQLNLENQWTDQSGNVKTLYLLLNACQSSKLTMPFKNQDWTINEFGFQAMADASGGVLTWATTE